MNYNIESYRNRKLFLSTHVFFFARSSLWNSFQFGKAIDTERERRARGRLIKKIDGKYFSSHYFICGGRGRAEVRFPAGVERRCTGKLWTSRSSRLPLRPELVMAYQLSHPRTAISDRSRSAYFFPFHLSRSLRKNPHFDNCTYA